MSEPIENKKPAKLDEAWAKLSQADREWYGWKCWNDGIDKKLANIKYNRFDRFMMKYLSYTPVTCEQFKVFQPPPSQRLQDFLKLEAKMKGTL